MHSNPSKNCYWLVVCEYENHVACFFLFISLSILDKWFIEEKCRMRTFGMLAIYWAISSEFLSERREWNIQDWHTFSTKVKNLHKIYGPVVVKFCYIYILRRFCWSLDYSTDDKHQRIASSESFHNKNNLEIPKKLKLLPKNFTRPHLTFVPSTNWEYAFFSFQINPKINEKGSLVKYYVNNKENNKKFLLLFTRAFFFRQPKNRYRIDFSSLNIRYQLFSTSKRQLEQFHQYC